MPQLQVCERKWDTYALPAPAYKSRNIPVELILLIFSDLLKYNKYIYKL